MLFFNKKKHPLKEYIPEGYIDIHSHLMYGIDDGSKSLKETIFLINQLKELRFEQFITTPHVMKNVWENTKESIIAKKEQTIIELKNNGIDNPFNVAAEYLMDGNLIDLMKKEGLLTLKDFYVLVEMSYLNPPIQLFDIIFELQTSGYKPILAHPERYLFYHNNFEEYQKIKNAGCLFQLNLLSVTGYYGKNVAEISEKLLKKGMIDFVGSDVHHQNHITSFNNKVLLKDVEPLKKAIQNNQLFRIF